MTDDEPICQTCNQPVLIEQSRNGVTGEHWECYKQRPKPVAKPLRFFPTVMNKDPSERYRRWWLGKRCRVVGQDEFKLVTQVEWIGAPSGFTGIVQLTFEDGTTNLVGDVTAYKPCKRNVEIAGEGD